MIFIIYFTAILALLGALTIAWSYFQGYTSKKWPQTFGKIVQSDLHTIPGNNKEKVPLIYYEYQINHQTYFSNRVAMYLATLKNDDAERILNKYPLGKEVLVKYHPFLKSHSVLETGPRQPFLHLFFFSFCLMIFGLSVMSLVKPNFDLIKLLFE